MKRPLGVCTWTYGPVPLVDIAKSLRRLSYDGVELHGDLDVFSPREAQTILSDQGLKIFSLTPSNVDIAHPDVKIRGPAIEYFKRLIDFSAELGGPIVSIHGLVGRVRAISSQEEEYGLLCKGVSELARLATDYKVPLVHEVLNRYESHLINTGAEAIQFMADTGCSSVRPLLDTYHMNIEEADLSRTVEEVGEHLGLFHIADTNRRGLGLGHLDVPPLMSALDKIEYVGPVIVECTAAGPDPFTPVKGQGYIDVLEQFLIRTRNILKQEFPEADLS